jgi:hypothetical protein
MARKGLYSIELSRGGRATGSRVVVSLSNSSPILMSVGNAVVVAKLIRSCLAGGRGDTVLLEDGQTLNIGPGDSSSNIYVELEAFDPFSVYVAVEIAADFATELENCIELSGTPA